MLKVQEYLRSGKTLEDLKNDLGIKVSYHPDNDNPLVILNYHQIDSPKTHPIIRECRGLVLDSRNYKIAARSFKRFYNWGEVQDEAKLFNFTNFHTQTKEDGSLVLIFKFEGKWYTNTRGSFAFDVMQDLQFHEDVELQYTWQECILKALGVKSHDELDSRLDGRYTYVGELVSPYNKIVRKYDTPQVYLLTAFKGEKELTLEQCDQLQKDSKVSFVRPGIFKFSKIEEIISYLKNNERKDPTFEGFIIRDDQNHRWKIKSDSYTALHRLKGEGDNIFNPKYQIPVILAGEEAEVLLHFEEATGSFLATKKRLEEEYQKLERVWQDTWQIKGGKANQKDFALAIQGRTPFTALLFKLRIQKINRERATKKKMFYDETEELLQDIWRSSADLIYKTLYYKKEKKRNGKIQKINSSVN